MFSLQGKVAVVTGAASGLGKATALRFARAGAKVVLADIADAAEAAAEAGGIYMKTDVSREEQVEELMQAAVSAYGKLTTVVNNAGIGGQMGTLDSITREGIDEALDINFKGVLWGIKHAAPLIEDGGSIMNTASYAGLYGTPTYGCYVASKAAIIAITKTAALELAPRGIRVNCICPGTADTPMAYIEGAEVELKLACMLQPLGRLVQPEEVAALYHFLASDDCSMVSGVAIPIDGGMAAGPGLGVIGPLYEKIFSEALNIEDFKAGE
jgi:3alpha(or 20beta)-hydroxysteroid dehydrogenase